MPLRTEASPTQASEELVRVRQQVECLAADSRRLRETVEAQSRAMEAQRSATEVKLGKMKEMAGVCRQIEEMRELIEAQRLAMVAQSEAMEARAAQSAEMKEQLQQLHDFINKFQIGSAGFRNRVQRTDRQGRGAQSRFAFRPSIEVAERQPTHVCEMSHEGLAMLAMQGNHSAHMERLIREIMCVENVGWTEAQKILCKLDQDNERFYWIESLPYRFAVTGAFIAGVSGVALVFWKPVAALFAVHVVGEELPNGEGETTVEDMSICQVGAWTWSWMEPMIGIASFVLLCCQFSRAQCAKMNMKSFGEYLLHLRADRLAGRFPQYDRSMLRAWAGHMPRVKFNFFPEYDRHAGIRGPTSGL